MELDNVVGFTDEMHRNLRDFRKICTFVSKQRNGKKNCKRTMQRVDPAMTNENMNFTNKNKIMLCNLYIE